MAEAGDGWAIPVVRAICGQCDWRYYVPEAVFPGGGSAPVRCPHCWSDALTLLEPGDARFPYAAPPELVVPFVVDDRTVAQQIETFAQGIPYAPADLSSAELRGRLQKLYLPVWLVDSDVRASWQAEVGFDYEVVSHQGRYTDGAGWQTREVEEGRVRWEPRAGTLQRHYDNVSAPALALQEAVQRALGRHDVARAAPAVADLLTGAVVRAPDRAPETAWVDAQQGLRQRAADECRRAAGADHIRDYRWAPQFGPPNWTLLLLPVYATYYQDDEGQPQRVLLNGQTGQLYGARRGSMARAQRVSLTVGIVALVLFLLSLAAIALGVMLPPALVIGIIGAVIAVGVGIGATVPMIRVWAFNRRESGAAPVV